MINNVFIFYVYSCRMPNHHQLCTHVCNQASHYSAFSTIPDGQAIRLQYTQIHRHLRKADQRSRRRAVPVHLATLFNFYRAALAPHCDLGFISAQFNQKLCELLFHVHVQSQPKNAFLQQLVEMLKLEINEVEKLRHQGVLLFVGCEHGQQVVNSYYDLQRLHLVSSILSRAQTLSHMSPGSNKQCDSGYSNPASSPALSPVSTVACEIPRTEQRNRIHHKALKHTALSLMQAWYDEWFLSVVV